MRYLKRFFENSKIIEVKEIAENCLAYLIDEGFKIACEDFGCFVSLEITNSYGNFDYDEIKDYIIPMITVMKDDGYLIGHINFIMDDPDDYEDYEYRTLHEDFLDRVDFDNRDETYRIEIMINL